MPKSYRNIKTDAIKQLNEDLYSGELFSYLPYDGKDYIFKRAYNQYLSELEDAGIVETYFIGTRLFCRKVK